MTQYFFRNYERNIKDYKIYDMKNIKIIGQFNFLLHGGAYDKL